VSVIYNAVENLQQYERISQLKCPKDMVKVLDIDWAASDKPVLATQDGCLRIMDMILTTSSSPLMDYELQGTNLHYLLSVLRCCYLQVFNPQCWNEFQIQCSVHHSCLCLQLLISRCFCLHNSGGMHTHLISLLEMASQSRSCNVGML